MKEIALPTTDFAENAVVNVSRVFAVLWCIAQNIYRKGEQRTMKMIENEMNVTVHLEIIKASDIRIFRLARLLCCRAIPVMGKAS